jgi:hypothetical protein
VIADPIPAAFSSDPWLPDASDYLRYGDQIKQYRALCSHTASARRSPFVSRTQATAEFKRMCVGVFKLALLGGRFHSRHGQAARPSVTQRSRRRASENRTLEAERRPPIKRGTPRK